MSLRPSFLAFKKVVQDVQIRTSIPVHSSESCALTSARKVLEVARVNVTTNIFSFVYTLQNRGVSMQNLIDVITLDRINWLHECHILNFSKVDSSNSGLTGLGIQVNTNDMIFGGTFQVDAVELKLSGKTIATRRILDENQFYSSGDRMILTNDDLKSGVFSQYTVKIKKSVNVEEDPGKFCRNYPNDDFQSFEDCDFNFMRKRVKEISPNRDLIPPWLTDDLDKVTVKPVALTIDQLIQLGKLSVFGNCH